jgi:hypothetical protein
MATGTETRNVARFGLWAALGTAVTTTITFGVAVATPPLSGPLCKAGCFRYPYLDVVDRFPRDYFWMFPALAAIVFYIALLVALDGRAATENRVVTRLGIAFGVVAATTLLGDYYVQLAVIQPSLAGGEADGIALVTQYNPHGLFIALEELGYILTSLSLVCMVPSLRRSIGLERAVRYVFVGSFVLTISALGWFMLRNGHARSYLFEIAVISIDWTALVIGAAMLVFIFRRDLAAATAHAT